ncbi:MAG: hypothetical protein Q7S30_05900 [Candidatus Omnitrophota bacterium]|nr:hypothetical protein [Candidatus Omnitrophota bacterium]
MTNKKYLSYDFWSVIILAFYAIMQILRWSLFPQHFDIYYHLLTAWGFIQAGGYPNWDFWQYAPVGRPHIYPPLFHIILALFMKAGVDKIVLAKTLSIMVPLTFLITLWSFLRKKFSSCLAFFSLIAISSSLSFYASLATLMPSTIALTFGILAIWQFMNGKTFFSLLFLTFCFYTHIGVSYYMTLTFIIYAFFDKELRRSTFIIVAGALILSVPMIIRQLSGIDLFSFPAIKANNYCEFKTIDYILGAIGFAILLRSKGKGRLFLALFIASFVYLPYLSRFFSTEGYLPVALLAAVALYGLCESFGKNRSAKYAVISITAFMLIFSPTIATGTLTVGGPVLRMILFDSAPIGMLFPKAKMRQISSSIWFEKSYAFASKLIKENSSPDDIIYCTENIIGLCLAVASDRATANYLLPEVYSKDRADPYADAKIIIMLKYHDPKSVKEIVDKYGLVLLGKNGMLDIYMNPKASAKMTIK